MYTGEGILMFMAYQRRPLEPLATHDRAGRAR
jgi:hypothetical protein